jgi:hypothetical protein
MIEFLEGVERGMKEADHEEMRLMRHQIPAHSNKCRQKAYRKRKAARYGKNQQRPSNRNGKRKRYGSAARNGRTTVQ